MGSENWINKANCGKDFPVKLSEIDGLDVIIY
jgi:hypothetical protein